MFIIKKRFFFSRDHQIFACKSVIKEKRSRQIELEFYLLSEYMLRVVFSLKDEK